MLDTQSNSLFEFNPTSVAGNSGHHKAAARKVIDKLLEVRRSMTEREQEFGLPKLTALIEDLRGLVRATPDEAKAKVLYSIERQESGTLSEITEDTRIHPSIVKQIVAELLVDGTLARVKRGSGTVLRSRRGVKTEGQSSKGPQDRHLST